MNLPKYRIAAVLLFLTSWSQNANADLILTLEGTTGSSVVNYSASGSVTITTATGGITSGLGLAPSSANWISGFDNDLGDILRNGMNTGLNDDLVLTGGGVSYRRNGVEFGVLNTLDLDGSSSAGADDIELDPTTNINYPSLVIGDTLSWTGSGTFTLEDSETFDSLFIALGSFSNAIDGGNYTVVIANAPAAVPEPGSLACCCGLAGFVVYRRRKKKKQQAEKTEE